MFLHICNMTLVDLKTQIFLESYAKSYWEKREAILNSKCYFTECTKKHTAFSVHIDCWP